MRWGSFALAALAWSAAACSPEPQALFQEITPLHGSTAVDPGVQPHVRLAHGVEIDAGSHHVVLVEVTGGGRRTVTGQIAVVGAELTYQPDAPLELGRQYQLEVQQEALEPSDHDELDATERPEEPVAWPYLVHFATQSQPRVRAAYFGLGATLRVEVRFSQPMNPEITGDQIEVLDFAGTPLPIGRPAWLDAQTVGVDLLQEPAAEDVLTLRVGRGAIAVDGTLLDGDDDGRPGETTDDFAAQFTGVQQVIRSRLK